MGVTVTSKMMKDEAGRHQAKRAFPCSACGKSEVDKPHKRCDECKAAKRPRRDFLKHGNL